MLSRKGYGFDSPVVKAQQPRPFTGQRLFCFLIPVLRWGMALFRQAVWDTCKGVPVPLPGLSTRTVCRLCLTAKAAGFKPVVKEPLWQTPSPPAAH